MGILITIFWIYIIGVIVNLLILLPQLTHIFKEWDIEKEFPFDVKRIVAYVLLSWISYLIILVVKLKG